MRVSMKRKTIFMAPKIWDRLKKLADTEGTVPSDLVRRAIFEFLVRKEGL